MRGKVVFLVTTQAEYVGDNIRRDYASDFTCIYQGGNSDGKLEFPDREVYTRFPNIEAIDGNHAVILHCGAPRPNSSTVTLFDTAYITNNPHRSKGKTKTGKKIYKRMNVKPLSKSVFFLYAAYGKADWPDQDGASIPIRNHLDILTKHFGIENIFTIDAHFAFKDYLDEYPIKNVSAKQLLIDYARENWKENFKVRGPDFGCSERMGVEGLPKLRLGVYNDKIHKGRVDMKKLRKVIAGEPVLVVDDLLQTGGTAETVGHFYLEAGAPEVALAITHVRQEEGFKRNMGHGGVYSKFIGTNSLPNMHARVDVTKLVADTVGDHFY